MPHSRRLPKPRGRRLTAIAAAVIVVGAGAFAASAVSGGSGGVGSAAGTPVAGRDGAAKAPAARTPKSGKQALDAAVPSAVPGGDASATATPSIVKPTASAGRLPVSPPSPTSHVSHARPGTAGVSVFTGLAFDTCTAPALSKMAAWHGTSPYGAAAVYVGGRNRGCAQPQLTASWVRAVSAAGWKLIPLYVGAQPPCQTGSSPEKITTANAAALGASDGADAVAQASALGMSPAGAVYLDMEAYNTADTACAAAVLTYVQAWDRALHARGYLAGFYGFSSSGAAAMAAAQGTAGDLPDALWYARYDGVASTTTGFPFAAGLWTGHRRGHQYLVNQKETFGGVTLTVDRDAWDAPVAVV